MTGKDFMTESQLILVEGTIDLRSHDLKPQNNGFSRSILFANILYTYLTHKNP